MRRYPFLGTNGVIYFIRKILWGWDTYLHTPKYFLMPYRCHVLRKETLESEQAPANIFFREKIVRGDILFYENCVQSNFPSSQFLAFCSRSDNCATTPHSKFHSFSWYISIIIFVYHFLLCAHYTRNKYTHPHKYNTYRCVFYPEECEFWKINVRNARTGVVPPNSFLSLTHSLTRVPKEKGLSLWENIMGHFMPTHFLTCEWLFVVQPFITIIMSHRADGWYYFL